ncbi:MAG: chloride channel protein [Bacteroidales bacterium]|jgi:CIC family chloride channel protein|nr:chloride channel protein [Bacteroidales bacterium]
MTPSSHPNIFKRISHSVRVWLERMPETRVVLLLAFIVGLGCGLAATLLLEAIHLVQWVLVGWFKTQASSWLYLVYPGVGMLIAYLLVRYLIKDNIGHGVTKVLLAISRYDSKIKPHNMWSSILTSAITIGFGGSVGAEAPIVYTGAAIGSNIGRKAGLTYKSVTLLLGCGAAGAIAGIFKAPMAGVLFTLEILLFNMSMTSILPLVLSSVTSTTVTYLLMGDAVAFDNTLTPFILGNIPFYVIFGILCGFASLYFTRTTLYTEDKVKAISNPFTRWALCAIGLGIMIFLFPPLYGEGYGVLTDLLNDNDMHSVGNTVFASLFEWPWTLPIFFALVFLVKVFSMSFTNAGGGVGGTFGPTLFMGGIFGFVIARSSNLLGLDLPETNFVLVGMAGLMAGVMQAPLTAIFLIAEITGGYTLLMPLIITSAISYATIRIFEPYSIYTKRIAKRGYLLTHDSDKAVLTLLKIDNVLETNFSPIEEGATLGDILPVISNSSRDIYPVLDKEGRLLGTVWLNDVKKDMFDSSNYSRPVSDYMEKEEICAHYDDRMEDVMNKFEQTGGWNLPVIDKEGKWKGFVSKSHIFFAYRERLHEVSHD